MKLISSVFVTAALLISASSQAVEVSGVELAERITIDEQTLVLNGAGVRSKFFIDLYVGSLYLATSSSLARDVLAASTSVVRLNITSGMITADKMKDAIVEGFDDATQGNTRPIQPQIDRFMALFSDEIVEGDQFTLSADKAHGVTTYKNGVPQATIEGEAFRLALLKIWLGDDPAQDSLKQAMLGE